MPHPDTFFRLFPAGPADRDALDAVFRASVAGLCRRHYTTRQLDAWLQRVTPQRWDELLHATSTASLSIPATSGRGWGAGCSTRRRDGAWRLARPGSGPK